MWLLSAMCAWTVKIFFSFSFFVDYFFGWASLCNFIVANGSMYIYPQMYVCRYIHKHTLMNILDNTLKHTQTYSLSLSRLFSLLIYDYWRGNATFHIADCCPKPNGLNSLYSHSSGLIWLQESSHLDGVIARGRMRFTQVAVIIVCRIDLLEHCIYVWKFVLTFRVYNGGTLWFFGAYIYVFVIT